MEIQRAYKQKLAAQLKEWEAQINLFEAMLENEEADMKIMRSVTLSELRSKQRTASEKMMELEKASGEAWEQLKEAADKIWEDLRVGIVEAHSKFK